MKYFRRHKFTGFLTVVFLVLLVVLIVKNIRIKNAISNNLLTGIEVQEYEDFMQGLKGVPSDIDGLSQYDKYKMGLDYHDGSDSDFDGLSDADEINIYGSDPLKSSTSGDLYSDSYKVTNGMDLFTSANYEDTIEFANNSCEEVKLLADDPLDFNAVVEDYTDRYSLADYGINDIYKGYWIYNYSGALSIDASNIIAANNLDVSDINVWIAEGDFLVYELTEFEKCKYSTNGNELNIEYDFDNSKAYFLYLAGKQNALKNVFTRTNSSLQLNCSSDYENVMLAVSKFQKIKVYYPKVDNAERQEQIYQQARDKFGDEAKYEACSIDKIKDKYSNRKRFVPFLEFSSADTDHFFKYLPMLVYMYEYYENGTVATAISNAATSSDNEHIAYANYHTDFDPYVDELPFQNFESEYGPAGNCTGISFLTAYLYNTGSFPESGNYNGIDWTLTSDAENSTILNKGLYDYKNQYFVDENSSASNNYIGSGLTSGEKEFVKMIGAYWQESNARLPYLEEYMISNEWSNDWDLIEKMMGYLDQGKILCTGLYLKNGTGHEINLYDYYFNESGEILFRVYDSNIPQNKMENMTLNCEGACYLQCKKVMRSDGTYGFTYLYYPVKGQLDYLASSNSSLMKRSSIIIADERWNVFN